MAQQLHCSASLGSVDTNWVEIMVLFNPENADKTIHSVYQMLGMSIHEDNAPWVNFHFLEKPFSDWSKLFYYKIHLFRYHHLYHFT